MFESSIDSERVANCRACLTELEQIMLRARGSETRKIAGGASAMAEMVQLGWDTRR